MAGTHRGTQDQTATVAWAGLLAVALLAAALALATTGSAATEHQGTVEAGTNDRTYYVYHRVQGDPGGFATTLLDQVHCWALSSPCMPTVYPTIAEGTAELWAEDNGCEGLQRAPVACDAVPGEDPADRLIQRAYVWTDEIP